jgi:hypothetical protein
VKPPDLVGAPTESLEARRADEDYARIRNAYVRCMREDPTHLVHLAMIGADLNRTRAELRRLKVDPWGVIYPGPEDLREAFDRVQAKATAKTREAGHAEIATKASSFTDGVT